MVCSAGEIRKGRILTAAEIGGGFRSNFDRDATVPLACQEGKRVDDRLDVLYGEAPETDNPGSEWIWAAIWRAQ